jgi:hypothetical protein
LKGILRAFTANAASKVDVFGHDSYALRMDGTQVGVLKKTDQVCFGSLLKCHDCSALEAEIGLEILGNFTNEALEGKLERQVRGQQVKSTTKG